MPRPLPLVLTVLALVGVLALSVPVVGAHNTAAPRRTTVIYVFTGTFETTIYRGPDAGLSLHGTLRLRAGAIRADQRTSRATAWVDRGGRGSEP